MSCRVAVLVSGTGTNLQALIDCAQRDDCDAEVALVVSNKADAFALERAQHAGIDTVYLDHRGKDRPTYDAELVETLNKRAIEWVFLAGFMRILSPVFLDAFAGRVVNIHPSLLPSFPGLKSQKRAFDAGVCVSGATVHFADAGTDTGAIIAQGVVPRLFTDTVEQFSDRILQMEHRLFPMVLRWACEGRLSQVDGAAEVQLVDGESRTLVDS